MKALRFHNGDLRLDEVSPPLEPLADQVVLKVLQCGICGTDLHEYVAGPIMLPVKPHPVNGAKIPVILGHEFSATVSSVGPAVTTTKPGGSRRDSSASDEAGGLLCSA
jgi:(R,R)-butanediol dehydrogenase/meso-butanediol dehydrogenase/diacetyl reductase